MNSSIRHFLILVAVLFAGLAVAAPADRHAAADDDAPSVEFGRDALCVDHGAVVWRGFCCHVGVTCGAETGPVVLVTWLTRFNPPTRKLIADEFRHRDLVAAEVMLRPPRRTPA